MWLVLGWCCQGNAEPSPFPAVPNGFQALALCDYPSSMGMAIVLRIGEHLHILPEDGEWWLMASEVSGKECHIPSSCVNLSKGRPQGTWPHHRTRPQILKAEELLLRPGNHSGSFLIRESQTKQGESSQTHLCYCSSPPQWVTHYHIHHLHNLVDHYSGNAPPGPWHPEQCVGDVPYPERREGEKVAAGPPCPGAPRLEGQGVHSVDAVGSCLGACPSLTGHFRTGCMSTLSLTQQPRQEEAKTAQRRSPACPTGCNGTSGICTPTAAERGWKCSTILPQVGSKSRG
uniref:SH2 domain-containing protein n=1 Tax=Zosterops lateralis melanops TaxID=1220523 RepID=A0A8D2QUY4_ZOSLA